MEAVVQTDSITTSQTGVEHGANFRCRFITSFDRTMRQVRRLSLRGGSVRCHSFDDFGDFLFSKCSIIFLEDLRGLPLLCSGAKHVGLCNRVIGFERWRIFFPR